MADEITYRAHDEYLTMVGGGRIELNEAGDLIVARSTIEPIKASSLTAALRRFEHYMGGPTTLDLREPPPGRTVRETSPSLGVDLAFKDGQLLVVAVAFSDDEPDQRVVEQILEPILKRNRATLNELNLYENEHDDGWLIYLTLRSPTRNKTVGQVDRCFAGASSRSLLGWALRSCRARRGE